MIYGPMFRREYLAGNRGRRTFLYRVFVAGMLTAAWVLTGLVVFRADSPGEPGANRLAVFGQVAFVVSFAGGVLLLVFFVPAFVAGSIAEEREKDTLPLLLLTRLLPIEVVATKMLARWAPAIGLVLTGVPFLIASAYVADLGYVLILALLVLFSSSLFMAALSILASASRAQAATARSQAAPWVFGWLIVAPVLTVLPVASSTLWGQLLAEAKSFCALIAPSSPVSFATDRAWYYRPESVSLGERVALMVGLQAGFGLLAILLAASRLKAREKNPNWTDPTRGYRPPCGDDPIFWREYELPSRRGGGPLLLLRLRFVWILIRATLLTILGLVAALLAVAIPLGLLFGALYYGVPAFQELWQYGYGSSGPFTERLRFNLVVRGATGALGLLPALGIGSIVSGRITTERDKKTWEAILTTPLTGEEIVRSKSRAALLGLWQAAWPVPFVWLPGIACGVVTPLGVALAAVDLALVVWLNLAIGLYLSLRPGLTSVASSRVALLTLLSFVIQVPLLGGLLASPRELAVFHSWDWRLRGGLVLCGLAILIATGWAAWWLTRRTLAKFDEWVGRPIRGDHGAGPLAGYDGVAAGKPKLPAGRSPEG